MAQVVVTRRFRLHDLEFDDDLFVQYKAMVNDQICQGLQLPTSLFENDSLVAVKRFYKKLTNQKNSLKERVHRCGAQLSYFAVREYCRNQQNLRQIVKILLNNGFFVSKRNHEQIVKRTDVSYFEVENKLNFIRNQMLKKLKEPDLSVFYGDPKQKQKYESLVSSKLYDQQFMDSLVKSFKLRAVRRLNKRFVELQNQQNFSNSSPISPSNYDTTILRILGLKQLGEVRNVSSSDWSKAKIAWKQELDSLFDATMLKIDNWGYEFGNLVLQLLKPRDDPIWINGANLKDLIEFVSRNFEILLKKQVLEYLKSNFINEISRVLRLLLKDLKKPLPSILKIPELSRSSIPLGIDDGQVYRLVDTDDNIKIKVSLIAKQFEITELKDKRRFEVMIKQGFQPQRGVLNFSQDKYYLYIPFTKKVSEERDGGVIAAADLGLKTLATISIYNVENENRKETEEIDRHFLDQKHFGGKKEDWFVNPRAVNLKSKLMDRRLIARHNQSKKMSNTKGTMRYWLAREREKTQWRKIKNINQEIIRQVSARIISLLNHHNVGTLVLENLKWSTHTPKSEGGYFLATWQVHWFYSQIQSMLINQCKLHGIKVELVNPKNSSKICSRCKEFGTRKGKQFWCGTERCKIKHIDSDLNAARNLVQRSKKYRFLSKTKINNI